MMRCNACKHFEAGHCQAPEFIDWYRDVGEPEFALDQTHAIMPAWQMRASPALCGPDGKWWRP